jgi:hypothetical protein
VKWRPFTYGPDTFDLCHLHPRTIVYTQQTKGEIPERTYTVEVAFSLHCFTRGIKGGESIDPALCYSDHRETRVFDCGRWQLSHQLPGIIADLARRKCYHTGRGNFFTVEVIDRSGKKVDYEVFFTAYRRSSGRTTVLNLLVQSAYVRDPAHSNRPHAKPIRLTVILYNISTGKVITIPK